MRLILHIGPHKTGTTYLQANLAHHRDRLASAGYFYPRIGTTAVIPTSHFGLYQAIKERMPTAIADLAEIATSECHTAILSAEDFSILTADEMSVFRDKFFPISVVYYYRPWPKLIASGIQQDIRSGNKAPVPELLMRHLNRPMHSPTINPDVVLQRFLACVSPDIRIVSFDRAVAGKKILASFLEAAAIDVDLPEEDVHRNVSSSPVETEIVRIANIVHNGQIPGGWESLLERITIDQDVMDALQAEVSSIHLTDAIQPFASMRSLLEANHGCRVVGGRDVFVPAENHMKFVSPNWMRSWRVVERLQGAILAAT